jgi:peptide/nickel transport system substrate-binding protein
MTKASILAILAFSLGSICFFQACKGDKTLSQKGNKAYVRIPAEPQRLNPLTTEEANSIQVMGHIFMSLLDYDPQTLAIQPVLAKTRPTVVPITEGVLKGGTAYTFEIRDEAVWDNGTPVTAADFVFTVKAILNPKSGANNLRSQLDYIKAIEIDPTNPKKFTLQMDKKYFMAEENLGLLPILPEYVYDTEGILKNLSIAEIAKPDTAKIGSLLSQFANAIQSPKFSRETVQGCGAYNLAEWKADDRLVLSKKKNWWGDKLASQSPYFEALPDELHFRIVKDEASATAQLKNGEFDAMTKISPKDFLEMQKNDTFKTRYQFTTSPTTNIVYAGINCKNPKLADKRTRRALAHLFDVGTIIQTALRGLGDPVANPFVPQRAYYNRDLKPIELNIEQAKTLLAAAGWKNTNADSTIDKTIEGKLTEFSIRFTYGSPQAKNIGLMFQENAAKAGIKVELIQMEAKAYLETLAKRDFDLFFMNAGLPPLSDDPKEMWASSSNKPDGGNRCQFENKAADVLIEQIRSELDETKRMGLYKKLQALIYDEQPAIFLFSPNERIALNTRFEAKAVARRPNYVLGQFKLK